MKRFYLSIVLTCLAVFCIIGCKSNDDTKEKIRCMQSKAVSVPFDQMTCWINDSVQIFRPWEKANMKLVVFTDSTQCSKCTMKTMYLWRDFIELEKIYDDRFLVLFIMEARYGTTNDIVSSFHLTELNHPMYIDSVNAFKKNNPHIPSEQIYHTFLLDEKNNVILVGNPLFNPKVERMLLTILKEKFRERS